MPAPATPGTPAPAAPAPAGANHLTDHPELYEARFPDPDHLAARFADELLRRHGAPGRRLLDAGCGTGRDAAHLAALGWHVTGIDTSHAMLDHARAHHPGPTYLHADLRSFHLPGTPARPDPGGADPGGTDPGGAVLDAVICMDSAMLYCHDNAELAGFLDSCRRHLAPGGLLLAEMRNGAFFLGNTELLDGPRRHSFRWQGVTHTSVTELRIDHRAQLLRRTRVWTADDGSPPLEQHSAWRLLFPRELEHFLDVAGFDTLALFDGPGPRTEPPWRPGAAPADTLHGDRLHLLARRR
ncbi:class I SAM-dependent methyltransferase [Allostreptomyces psammosilenae]|uniref:class I SAM-dependent methyltransferase n=1 Tax=Allostreptomyces psammosilenae TaxID=1892865 RepID=UPI0015CAFAA6|nr:class I SAM-dependent methyltransferase [Allostreptomyces psammosilenae]